MVVVNKGNGTVSEGTGGSGTKIIAKRYPLKEGLTAGDSIQIPPPFLEEQGF